MQHIELLNDEYMLQNARMLEKVKKKFKLQLPRAINVQIGQQ